MNYKDFFKSGDTAKNIAVVGLGPHGEMVADIKFLLKLGVQVSLYDIRSEQKLEKFLPALEQAGLVAFSFGAAVGKMLPEKLLSFDLIILSPEVSRKSLFLKKAAAAGIPIEFPQVLFLKLAPPITLVGVMGACGKSTVAHMIHGMLKKSFVEYENQGLYFTDPDSTSGALSHLKKIKQGDVVLTRVPEDMMQEYYHAHISPHVAVITSLTSFAGQEVRGAFNILEHQTYNNFIVAPDSVVDAIKKQTEFTPKAKMIRMRADNKALALQAAELFKVSSEISEGFLARFVGLKARQEMVKNVKGVEFYNDAASITPHATLFALRTFSIDKNIILILGGAYTGYEYGELVREIPLYAKAVILLPGSATLGFREAVSKLTDIKYLQAPNLEEAVVAAKERAIKGDRVIFSPGCEAIGIDLSRKERGERFVKAVRGL